MQVSGKRERWRGLRAQSVDIHGAKNDSQPMAYCDQPSPFDEAKFLVLPIFSWKREHLFRSELRESQLVHHPMLCPTMVEGLHDG